MDIYHELFSVRGKRALVTGASSGIGRAMAEALCEGGAEVAAVGSGERVFEAAKEMGAMPLRADLSDREQTAQLVGRAVDVLGGLDVLVNAAGVQRRHPSEVFPIEDWDLVLAVNLEAVFVLCRDAGKHMLEHGGGKIINVASVQSFTGGLLIPAYAASKGGVSQLTKTLANEWASRGVNVNAVAPGYVATNMTAALVGNPEREPGILSRVRAGRWGRPDDFKGITLFLASGASDFVHGAVISVDGGYMAS